MSEESLTFAHERFLRAVETTRDARFAAEKPLRRRQRASAHVVSSLSLHVIALSLLPDILDLAHHQNQVLLACSIVPSVFVTFACLLDGSEDSYHNADLLHACARKVAKIDQRLKDVDAHGDQASEGEGSERLQERCERALADCHVNHDAVDFLQAVVAEPHLFSQEYGVRFPETKRRVLGLRLAYGRSSWAIIPSCAIASVTLIVFAYVNVGSKVAAAGEETGDPAATRASGARAG